MCEPQGVVDEASTEAIRQINGMNTRVRADPTLRLMPRDPQ
jgi:hypothetical protein